MPLQKQALNINFAQGLETKADPWQVEPGKMLEMVNTVFNKTGMLTKRNGYEQLVSLPKPANYVTTYRDNLIAIKDDLLVLSSDNTAWYDRGDCDRTQLTNLSLARSANSQVIVDTAVDANLACTVWRDSTNQCYYQIADATTGVSLQPPTSIGVVNNPRVVANGAFFVIIYVTNTIPYTLRIIGVPYTSPDTPTAPQTLSTQMSGANGAYDAVVSDGTLYVAFNGSDVGGAIRAVAVTKALLPQFVTPFAGESAVYISVTVDESVLPAKFWVTYQTTVGGPVKTMALGLAASFLFSFALSPTQILPSGTTINQISTVATNNTLYAYYQVNNTYPSGARSDFIRKVSCDILGAVGPVALVQRSIGLASKVFLYNGQAYFLGIYGGTQALNDFYQPSYFLIKDLLANTTGTTGTVISGLAYSNGSGYATSFVLPSANLIGSRVFISYLRKTLIYPVNKNQNANSASNVNVYAQQGTDLAVFAFGQRQIIAAEAAGTLLLTGGLLWMFDGDKPVEHGFNVYPEDINTTDTSGGSMTHQIYFYQITYEWTDNSGQIHRSAPCVPIKHVLTNPHNSITLQIPTLRLTYKTGTNPVRIVIYRWSTGQQIYYQVTPVNSPILNDPTVDYITYVDTQADSSITGNQIIYTSGGVLENTPSPSAQAMTLFKSRLFLIDGENRNRLWYSKPILEATPVEMTDLQTIFVAPTISSQGSTGDMKALVPMDDKLIIFKDNSIYYLTGNGPDATGTNNDYGDPAFITSTAGCSRPNSIINTPNGIMFQSDKGIWLLGRDFSTNYIGAPVEAYNNSEVTSAVLVPGTNQVRFTLDTGQMLVYDYFFNQWSTFEGVPGLSSTIYQGKHVVVDKYNRTFREKTNYYYDGGVPVTMRFKSAWFKMAGLQGFQRAYYFMILGKYISPHKLVMDISYDYNNTPVQNVTVYPQNFSDYWGGLANWGAGASWGGASSSVEQWRIFLKQQKCESFQITMREYYDPTLGAPAGAGLTLSGLNLIVGVKKGWNTLAPKLSTS